MKLVPRIKIWISTETGESVFGGGKYRLLKAIEEEGSLAAAAVRLNISYRKAWGDLKKAEEHLGKKLIVKERGGSGGGRTVLTPEGSRLMVAYRAFVEEVVQRSDEAYATHLTEISRNDFESEQGA